MELVSLLILVLGIAALVILYVMSRVSRKDLPKKQSTHIPKIKDEDGNEISSVMEDRPATDGSTPKPQYIEELEPELAPNENSGSDLVEQIQSDITEEETETSEDVVKKVKEQQLILFIAAADDAGLSGSKVLKVFEEAGLQFGEMDIFHRVVLSDTGETNLFGVANGVEPWTLVPSEVKYTSIPGMSVIMNIPTLVDDQAAIEDFVRTANFIAENLGGVLKNNRQETFSEDDYREMMALVL